MTPSLSIDYSSYASSSYAYYACYCMLGFAFGVKASNLLHNLSVYYGSWIGFAAPLASFLGRVTAIVSVGSKKEMIWIHTRRVVAFVKNMQFFWKMTMRNNPSNARSNLAFGSPRLEHSISVFGSKACPIPTGVGFVNKTCKPFIFQGPFSIPAATLRAIRPSFWFYKARAFVKLFFASFADKLHNDDSAIMETSLSTP